MKREFLSKVLVAAMFLIISLSVSVTATFAQKSPPEENQNAVQNIGGAALSSGLFSLAPGQAVRVAAVNLGDGSVRVNIVFFTVDDQGKLAGGFQCNGKPAPGDAMFDTFTHPGGANRTLHYVQIQVRQNPNDIKNIAPSLEIFDVQAGPGGGPIRLLSGGDFVSFKPIVNPPFAPEN